MIFILIHRASEHVGTGLFGLAVLILAVSVTGHFSLAVSVWGHFGHDISVYKQLITFVYLNDYR